MFSEKPYNMLHMKISFILVKTGKAGKTEAIMVAAQNRHTVTGGAGKGVSHLVSLSKQMKTLESTGKFFFLSSQMLAMGHTSK